MIEININQKPFRFFGKLKGGNGNKFNRIAKLAAQFDELDLKLTNFIKRGNFISEQARCALALRLMMHTGIRIGNEDSAEGYTTKPHPNSKAVPTFVQTYGLTTLKSGHFNWKNDICYVSFVGKKSVENNFTLSRELSDSIKQYFSSTETTPSVFNVSAYELTKFIKRSVGRQFTPKDFRCLRANMEAWNKSQEIRKNPVPGTKTLLNAEIKAIAVHVSECLNNTAGVCKKSYIDPMFFEYYKEIRWTK